MKYRMKRTTSKNNGIQRSMRINSFEIDKKKIGNRFKNNQV